MKLSDIQGEKALDLWAEIIEPVSVILSDPEIKNKFQGETRLKLAQYVIKNHKKEVIEIMARLDGQEPDGYKVNFFTLPMKVLEILNDPGIVDLFTLQGQNEE